MSLAHAIVNTHAQKRWLRSSARYFPPIFSLLQPTADPAIFFQIFQHFYLPNVCTVLFLRYPIITHLCMWAPHCLLYFPISSYHFSHTKLLSNCVIARVFYFRILWQLTPEISHALLPISYFPYFSESKFTTQTARQVLLLFLVLAAPPLAHSYKKVLPFILLK
jgi:hypothetical protein